MEAPRPTNEFERLSALRRYAVLDTPQEQAFDRLTNLAARLFGVPIVLVSLVDEERQWFKACYGLDARETGRELSFCAYAILSDDVMVVPDALADRRFVDNPVVTGPPHIRFYAGAPLKTHDGLNLGSLCLVDTKPRDLSAAEKETLVELAAIVIDELELRLAANELRRQTAERRQAEEALRQREETLRGLIAASPDLITLIDTTRCIGMQSDASQQILGIPAEDLLGQDAGELIRKLVHPEDQALALGTLGAVLSGGQKESRIRFRIRHANGRWVTLEARTRLTHDVDNEPAGVVIVARDVGVQVELEEHLRTAKQEAESARESAERANLAKSEFLSRMSHELRTPLNAVIGFGQLLELDDLTDDQQQQVGLILKGGLHLLDLINEVLDLARIESGRMHLSPEPVAVSEVVSETVSLIRPLAAKRNVRVTESMRPGSLPAPTVLADRQRLKQVLLNLLGNATKYNRDGGSVSIECGRAEDSRLLRISVRDTGPGIAPEKMKRLFVPFDRLGAEETSVEGTGLGLALSRRLVEAMGGAIGAESVQGQGSTFWVELPVVSETAVEMPDAAPHEPASLAIPHVDGTILYIEDNISNLELMERVVRRRPGVKLLSAMQGRFGLDLARQYSPDLILLDLHLPDVSGHELLLRIKAEENLRAVPVVVISADATAGQIARLKSAGASDYLTKPFDLKHLLAIIDQTLAGANSRGS